MSNKETFERKEPKVLHITNETLYDISFGKFVSDQIYLSPQTDMFGNVITTEFSKHQTNSESQKQENIIEFDHELIQKYCDRGLNAWIVVSKCGKYAVCCDELGRKTQKQPAFYMIQLHLI
jgi:hypothetical protein